MASCAERKEVLTLAYSNVTVLIEYTKRMRSILFSVQCLQTFVMLA